MWKERLHKIKTIKREINVIDNTNLFFPSLLSLKREKKETKYREQKEKRNFVRGRFQRKERKTKKILER